MNNSDPFWMIYGIGQGRPSAQHRSYDVAAAEAKRLARQNPGVRFVVLQAIRAFEKLDVMETTISDPDIPF
ncbi:hypothetical protein [Roseibium sp.]|uniref:hypothetical protein n=1 Tax=Roseibium sp. TaxID=1936156 RepID=UPI003B51CDEB